MRFRLGSIPVHVHPTFLFIALLAGTRELEVIIPWTIAAFIAVLAHELGHALTVRAFGIQQVHVTLFALGGVTTYPAIPRLSPGRQFMVSAAGSTVGIAMGGAAFFLGRAGLFDAWPYEVRIFFLSLVWVGAVFGLFNWLPIRPLDGGQMLTSALELVVPRRAETIALTVHVVVGAIAAVLAFQHLSRIAGFFIVFIVITGLSSSRKPTAESPPRRDTETQTPTSEPPPADDQQFPI